LNKTTKRTRSGEDIQKEKVKALKGENSEFRKQIKILEKRVLALEKRVDKISPKKPRKTKKAEEREKLLEKFHPYSHKDKI